MNEKVNQLMQQLNMENQLKIREAEINLSNASEEQLRELCLIFFANNVYRDQKMAEIAYEWAKGESDKDNPTND